MYRCVESAWTYRDGRKSIAVFVLFCALMVGMVFAAYQAMYPDASGDSVFSKKDTTIDYSHSDQGYIMVKHSATDKKIKLRVSLGQSQCTYDLDTSESFVSYPLTFGDGKYKLEVFKQVSGKKFAAETSTSIKVAISDENLPYLYPSQYVNYTADNAAVAKSAEICAGLTNDVDKINAVYQYVTSNIVYDHVKALTVQTGYLPSVDATLAEQKGICFDYAALMACMLRTQGIPTQLVIGYADKTYHSWNSVLANGTWNLLDATAAASGMTVNSYTVERIY